MSATSSGLGTGRYSGRTFVVYACPRTGSNVLVSLLNSHPDVLCHYELFNSAAVFSGLAEKRIRPAADTGVLDRLARDRDPRGFLDDLYALGAGYAAQGFKLLAGQHARILRESLADRASRSLVLKRRDLLKTFISGCVARKTGAWTRDDEQRLGVDKARRRIRFNAHAFRLFLLRTFAFYAAVEAGLNAAGKDYRVLYYEDLVGATDDTLARIGAYLGLPAAGFDPARCWFSRQNPESAFDLVDNPEQMARVLARLDTADLFSRPGRGRALWLAALARIAG